MVASDVQLHHSQTMHEEIVIGINGKIAAIQILVRLFGSGSFLCKELKIVGWVFLFCFTKKSTHMSNYLFVFTHSDSDRGSTYAKIRVEVQIF